MKNPFSGFCFFVFLFLTSGFGLSNQKFEPGKKQKTSTYKEKKAAQSSPWTQTNPIKLFTVGLIRMYQVLLSSQDGPTCQFRPSCSHFGASAIKEHGAGLGVLMTADRLLRCHPDNPNRYSTAEDGFHFKDPVPKKIKAQ